MRSARAAKIKWATVQATTKRTVAASDGAEPSFAVLAAARPSPGGIARSTPLSAAGEPAISAAVVAGFVKLPLSLASIFARRATHPA
jgi:hypothetical protein